MHKQVGGRCQVLVEPAHYTNNERPLGRLDEWFLGEPGSRVAIVRGAPGSGCTMLANVWVQRRRDNFPDGLFFVRLASGADGSDRERGALRELLLAVGYRPDEIPDSLDGRVSWWRSWSDGKRVGLVIDDALTVSQVRSLLPGSGGSAVLVTEAGPLSGLLASATATIVDLDPMAAAAAEQLLGRFAGAERVAADPDAVKRLVSVCEGSTIALCVVGTMLADSDRPISRLADRLSRDERVLRELSKDSSLSVTVVFDAAYQRVSELAQACYAALGMHPGAADVGAEAVAAAVGQPIDDVTTALEDLARARLVTETSDGRVLMSGLVRRHARTKASEPEKVVALFLGYYLAKSAATAMVLNPNRMWHKTMLPTVEVADFDVMPWLDAESANLRAAVEDAFRLGELALVRQFAIALWPYYERGGHTQDLAAVSARGIQAARGSDDEDLAESVLGAQEGFAHLQRGAVDWAIAVSSTALEAAVRSGDKEAQATAIETLALGYLANGEPEAVGLLRRNLKLAQDIRDDRRIALARLHLAKAVAPEEARSLFDEAAAGLAGERNNIAKIDLWRGRKLGDEQALRRVLKQGEPRERAEALVELSEVDSANARQCLREALDIACERGLTELSVEVEARLARLA